MDSDGRSGRTAGTGAVRREELGILALNTDEAEGERRTGKGYQREKTGKPCSLRPTTEPLSQLRGSKVCAF